ncbi:hypothetical protein ATE62_00840 [Sphingopyxis sp. HIX]|nr:hypothetical protein ATE62_00840 [Sphingopyxis sp. HIX]KTE85757.1 hypothetical protein ATE72_01995 [Sphingopyxis sp. HXXIV]
MDVISCRAEALPFEDRSFDVVTLDYVAHHTENLPRALREASRVARCAVLILDCWFDDIRWFGGERDERTLGLLSRDDSMP